jgi:hypothetical protein
VIRIVRRVINRSHPPGRRRRADNLIPPLRRALYAEVLTNSLFKHPVIGGLADVWISYIFPAEEYRRGGYESSVSFCGEKLGDAIVSGAIAGVEELNKQQRMTAVGAGESSFFAVGSR